MNTQGWIRGLVAKNMDSEKFLAHVVECLGREFEVDATLNSSGNRHVIRVDGHEIMLHGYEARLLQQNGAYALDRFLMEELAEMGFGVDVNRSQYVRYCFGIFEPHEGNPKRV